MENRATGLLVVGYGNPLNGDDGAGWSAAIELETLLKNTPHADRVEIMVLHQLTPELHDTISRFKSVIFIGVCHDKRAGVVSCRRIGFSDGNTETTETDDTETGNLQAVDIQAGDLEYSNNVMSGRISPEMLVKLAITKHNASPEAFLYTISGLSFEHGETVSRPVKRGIQFVVENIKEILLRDFGCPENSLVDNASKGLFDVAKLDAAEVV
jgi:Ni,Fe-hydrogenase maturation factor